MKFCQIAVMTVAALAGQVGSARAQQKIVHSHFSTTNFTVAAVDAKVAKRVALAAEQFRKSKAVEWLGNEIPAWDRPCPIVVDVTNGGAGGATHFDFDSRNGRFTIIKMSVEGPLNRILESVLPHEVTHTIFASKFRRPLPRWADEGGSVLSEDFEEVKRHDLLVRKYINSGRMLPLHRMFVLEEYPTDMNDLMCLYAQGFSVSNYLVSLKGKIAFLDFVWDGQERGWEPAIQQYYGFKNYRDLERKWIQWIIAGVGTGADGTLVESGRQYPTIPGVQLKSNGNELLANRSRTNESSYRSAPQRPTASGVGMATVYADAPYATNGEPKTTQVMQATRDAFGTTGNDNTRVSRPIATNQPANDWEQRSGNSKPWSLQPVPRTERVAEVDDSQMIGTTRVAVRDVRSAEDDRRPAENVATRTYESPQAERASEAPAPRVRQPIPMPVGRTRRSAQPERYSD